MDQHIEQLIRSLVSEKTGINKTKILSSSRLGADLGLDGDDALELLQEIESKFTISMQNFDFNKYFNDESDIWGIRNYLNKLFNKKNYIVKKHEICIKDLTQWAVHGHWKESIDEQDT